MERCTGEDMPCIETAYIFLTQKLKLYVMLSSLHFRLSFFTHLHIKITDNDRADWSGLERTGAAEVGLEERASDPSAVA